MNGLQGSQLSLMLVALRLLLVSLKVAYLDIYSTLKANRLDSFIFWVLCCSESPWTRLSHLVASFCCGCVCLLLYSLSLYHCAIDSRPCIFFTSYYFFFIQILFHYACIIIVFYFVRTVFVILCRVDRG